MGREARGRCRAGCAPSTWSRLSPSGTIFSAPDGITDWAVATFALNTVSRGADVGVVSPKALPDPLVDLMWSHLQFSHNTFAFASDGTAAHESMVAHMLPSKDTQARKQRVPVPIARRKRPEGASPDPVCAFHWVRVDWLCRQASVPPQARESTLFFTHADGRPYTSEDVAAIGKRIASLAGWPAEEVALVGAKWARIGGATDFYDEFAEEGRAISSSGAADGPRTSTRSTRAHPSRVSSRHRSALAIHAASTSSAFSPATHSQPPAEASGGTGVAERALLPD